MEQKTSKWAIVSISVLLLFFFFSCEKQEYSVGTNFLDGEKFGAGIYRDAKIISYTTRREKIVTSSSTKNLLGAYKDAIFGTTIASFGIQLDLEKTEPDFGKNAKVDSVVLTMPYLGRVESEEINYDTDSIYGNKNTAMSIKIFELDKLLIPDSLYYSNVDLMTKGSPLYETSNFVANFDSISVGDKKIPAAFRVKLDKNFFQSLILDNQGNVELADNGNFIKAFNGLAFTTTSTDGAIYTFDMYSPSTSLVIYYKNEDVDAEGKSLGTQEFELIFNNRLSRVNKYEFDLSTITDPNSTLASQLAGDTLNGVDAIFIQGISGLEGTLKLFADSDQLKALRDSNWVINEASLVYRVSDDNGNAVAPPFSLYMYNRDAKDTENFKIIDDLQQVSFGGLLNKDPRILSGEDRYYKFRITTHVHKLLNGDIENGKIVYEPNYAIKIVPFSSSQSVARVKINGDKALKNNLFLEIRHSKKD